MKDTTKSISSGFRKLDEITGGFFSSEVTIIGSKPGAGKSSFMLDIIRNICVNKKGKPLFFSIDM